MSFLKNYKTRTFFFIIGDIASIIIASLISLLIVQSLAGEFTYPKELIILFSAISITMLGIFRMYKVSWRFTSLNELLMIFAALVIATVSTLFLFYITGNFVLSQGTYMTLVFVLSLLLVGAFRISKRMRHEVMRKTRVEKRAIIFGAGNAGDQIMRDIKRHKNWNLSIIAVFDDSDELQGLSMHGIPVKGDRRKLYQFLQYRDIDELIIAIPSLPKKELKEIIGKVKSISPRLKIKVLPSFHTLSDDPVGIKNVREISIDDILGREPVRIDLNAIRSDMKGKIILITGAGGSIGREIVRQCANLDANKIIALDIDETEVFYIQNEFDKSGKNIQPVVANILDKHKIDSLLKEEKPDIIFHAAAYKHVPMMELFPEEAVKVNVDGTNILAELACKYEIEKFVLISTDKAVNPTNIMGATKRLAEEICLSFNDLCITKFIAVRFGNVLGSRGSVVPIFLDQIRNGGPVTITDPNVSRYFMTIPESVLLVLEAGFMGIGGEVFVLDMGEPVRIKDMAEQLIKLHGLEPNKDVAIEYVGLRPGEKMFEELLLAEEGIEKTQHELIHKAKCRKNLDKGELQQYILRLSNEIEKGDNNSVRELLKKIVPSFNQKPDSNHSSMVHRTAAFTSIK
ncbi:MAG: polysaccharide biosynthesis protein [Balneolaceae bacterium]|nr:MAG: polysaccharide biosynthesis protein [Balneolaceae bacterium]